VGLLYLLVPLAVDAAAAVVSYLLAYRLRFPETPLLELVTDANRTLLLMVIGHLAGLALTRVYSPAPVGRKIWRLFLGAGLGGALAVAAVYGTTGFAHLSRATFLVDLFLFWVIALGWRTFRVFLIIERTSAAETPNASGLVDRAVERQSVVPTLFALLAYRELIRNLVHKDLKLKYRGSVLGFVWSLVNPLALVGVYTVAFKYILGVKQPGFPFFILIGVMAWSFFANSAVMATGAIIDGGSLVKAVRFPRAVLPIATVLFNLAQYLLMLVVFLPAMFLTFRVPSVGPLLMFPAFLAMQLAFTVGTALLLAAATAYFRDVRHFVDIALLMLFWTTPIVYPLSQVPDWLRLPILLSPMSPFIVAYHAIFFDGVAPDASVWAVAIAYSLTMLALGTVWFVSVEDELSEHL